MKLYDQTVVPDVILFNEGVWVKWQRIPAWLYYVSLVLPDLSCTVRCRDIKIFQVDDYDYVAAESLGQAMEWYLQYTGITKEECGDDQCELSDARMNRMIFVEDSGERNTFKKKLWQMIKAGAEFPCLFACSEY